jgi:hypothetical protein
MSCNPSAILTSAIHSRIFERNSINVCESFLPTDNDDDAVTPKEVINHE